MKGTYLGEFEELVLLALGLSACLLIGLYGKHERSYDRFHGESSGDQGSCSESGE